MPDAPLRTLTPHFDPRIWARGWSMALRN